MATIKGLVANDRAVRNGGNGVRPVWRRIGREALGYLAGVRVEVIRSESACLALALIFSTTVVVPGILIFYDRSLPFEYVDSSIIEKTAAPGERVHYRLIVRKVKKDCRGNVERTFVDAAGQTFPLASVETVYTRYPDQTAQAGGSLRIVTKTFKIPDEAAPGEGTYIAASEFWCYPLQNVWPVAAQPQRAKVTVVRPVPGEPTAIR